MVFSKANPAGVDVRIQKMQQGLHDYLLTKWGITSAQYNAYGRCYRNQRGSDWIPEVYNGANEYQELFLDDRMAAISFFGISEAMITYANASNHAEIHLIFLANIGTLKSTLAWRADEEVRKDVQDYCIQGRFGFMLTGIDLWIDKVFREYGSWIRRQGEDLQATQMKYRDMQPFHAFRLNFKVAYFIDECN